MRASDWWIYDLDGAGSEEQEMMVGFRTAEDAAKEFALNELTDDGSSDEPRDEIRVAVRRVSETRWRKFLCRVRLEPRASVEELSEGS